MKRILSALLCLVLVVALASPALAAKEKFSVSKVTATIAAPSGGSAPSFSASLSTGSMHIYTSASSPYISGVKWTQASNGKNLTSSDTFIASEGYTLSILVQTNTGCSWDKDSNGNLEVSGTINGISANVSDYSKTDKVVELSVFYPGTAKQLTTASVSGIDTPVAGATPDYTASVGSSNYKLLSKNNDTFKNGITWYDSTDGAYMKTTKKFVAGHSYMVEVHLVPASGYTFSDDTTGTVNGKDIGVVAGGGEEVALVYDFDVCQEQTATSAPVITLQPQNPTWPEYGCASYTVKASGTGLTATWYIEYKGKTYNMSDFTNGWEPWEGYAGETYGPTASGNTFTCSFNGIEKGLDGASVYCVISNSKGSVTSAKAIVSVGGNASPPTVEVPVSVTAYKGDSVSVTCKATGSGLSYCWYETSSGKLQDIIAMDRGGQTSATLKADSSAVGTRYYVCMVTNSAGGATYSSVIPVKVLEKKTAAAAPQITTKSLPEATVGKAYKAKLTCSDGDATFSVWYNPGKSNDFEKTGLVLTQHGDLEGTPKKAGTYTFCICAAGEGGEDYKELTLKVVEASQDVEDTPTEPTVEVTAEPSETVETEPEEVKTTGAEEEEEGKKPFNFNFLWILIPVVLLGGVGVLAVGLVLLLILLRKKKK